MYDHSARNYSNTLEKLLRWRQGYYGKSKMATHGSIGEFQHTQEPWQCYVERLQQYFIANDVDATEKQRAILLSIVGGKTYQLIRNFLGPAKPTERSFDEIVEAVRNHYQPVPSVIVKRFNFHTRACKLGENVSTYVSELRKLLEYCNFGDTLEDMLRDRLICGINDNRVKRHLLAEPGLTFAKALELAQAAETAESNAKQLEQVTQSTVVHTVSSRKKGGGSHRQTAAHREIVKCYRCGGKHISDRCYFKNSNCHHCGKTGHIAKIPNKHRIIYCNCSLPGMDIVISPTDRSAPRNRQMLSMWGKAHFGPVVF